jgi:hypothetical protein
MVSRILSDMRASGLLRIEAGRTLLHEAVVERDDAAPAP